MIMIKALNNNNYAWPSYHMHTKTSNTYPQSSNIHTHTKPFYSSLDFVRDTPDKLVPEGTFRHLLDFLLQNEDNIGRHTNNPDGLPLHPD